LVTPLNRAWLECLPEGCTHYNHLQVQAVGRLAVRGAEKQGKLIVVILAAYFAGGCDDHGAT
jgi:hypothetical protein